MNFPLSQPRNHGLDVLRGIAVLLVIIHHLALPFRLTLFNGGVEDVFGRRIANALTYGGSFAVYLFFVLSGFLIAGRVLQKYGALTRINVRQFYVQRLCRIMPLLLVLVAVLSALHLIGTAGYIIDQPGQSLMGAVVAAFGLHLNLYESWHGYLPGAWDVLWSLSIEELFYLIFPLACLLLRSWLMPMALVALVVSMPATLEAAEKVNAIWGEKAYLPSMAAIALGVLGAQLHNRFRLTVNFARALLWLGTVAFIGLPLYRGLLRADWGKTVELLFCLSCFMLTLACATLFKASADAPKSSKRPIWIARVLAHLGRLSYELYLTHMFVVLGITALYRAVFPQQLYWAFAIYPVALLLCERLAYATQRWIGEPLGRRMLRMLTGKN